MLLLGWLLIGLVLLLISFNSILLFYDLFNCSRILYLRWKNRAAMKKKGKLPSSSKISKVLPEITTSRNENDNSVEKHESESCSNAVKTSFIEIHEQNRSKHSRNIQLLMLNQIKREAPPKHLMNADLNVEL